jgi:hypothetical protein
MVFQTNPISYDGTGAWRRVVDFADGGIASASQCHGLANHKSPTNVPGRNWFASTRDLIPVPFADEERKARLRVENILVTIRSCALSRLNGSTVVVTFVSLLASTPVAS